MTHPLFASALAAGLPPAAPRLLRQLDARCTSPSPEASLPPPDPESARPMRRQRAIGCRPLRAPPPLSARAAQVILGQGVECVRRSHVDRRVRLSLFASICGVLMPGASFSDSVARHCFKCVLFATHPSVDVQSCVVSCGTVTGCVGSSRMPRLCVSSMCTRGFRQPCGHMCGQLCLVRIDYTTFIQISNMPISYIQYTGWGPQVFGCASPLVPVNTSGRFRVYVYYYYTSRVPGECNHWTENRLRSDSQDWLRTIGARQ